MALGPLEYLVVGCEENHFMDQILPELHAAWEKGVIRIVDLFLFSKNESSIAALQLNDLSGEKADHLALLSDDLLGLLTPDDIEQLARAMLNNRSVVIVLFEHPWAVDLKETCGWHMYGRRTGDIWRAPEARGSLPGFTAACRAGASEPRRIQAIKAAWCITRLKSYY